MEESPQVSSPQKASCVFLGLFAFCFLVKCVMIRVEWLLRKMMVTMTGRRIPLAKHLSMGFYFYLMNDLIKNILKQWYSSPQTFQETQLFSKTKLSTAIIIHSPKYKDIHSLVSLSDLGLWNLQAPSGSGRTRVSSGVLRLGDAPAAKGTLEGGLRTAGECRWWRTPPLQAGALGQQ